MQRIFWDVAQVHAVENDGTILGVPQARQQACKGGLPGPGRPHQRRCGASGNIKVDLVQRPCARRIGERDVLHRDVSAGACARDLSCVGSVFHARGSIALRAIAGFAEFRCGEQQLQALFRVETFANAVGGIGDGQQAITKGRSQDQKRNDVLRRHDATHHKTGPYQQQQRHDAHRLGHLCGVQFGVQGAPLPGDQVIAHFLQFTGQVYCGIVAKHSAHGLPGHEPFRIAADGGVPAQNPGNFLLIGTGLAHRDHNVEHDGKQQHQRQPPIHREQVNQNGERGHYSTHHVRHRVRNQIMQRRHIVLHQRLHFCGPAVFKPTQGQA